MPSMGSTISAHNKRVLSSVQHAIATATTIATPPCYCRKGRVYSLNGDCRQKGVIYQATMHAPDMTIRTYTLAYVKPNLKPDESQPII